MIRFLSVGFSTAALLSGIISAHANDDVTNAVTSRWDGRWCTTDSSENLVELTVANDTPVTLHVAGKPLPLKGSEVSPDRRTILFRWDTGEGTIIRVNEGQAELSIFDRSVPVRTRILFRK